MKIWNSYSVYFKKYAVYIIKLKYLELITNLKSKNKLANSKKPLII